MFLIIQTGDPVPAAMNLFGRFSDWFIQGMGFANSNDQVSVVDVHLGQALPCFEKLAEDLTGIIITGSPAMITDQDTWLLKTQQWLNQIMAYKIPTLGVCFGHQLLADLLGGQVAYNPKGRNLGMSEFTLSKHAFSDPLLQCLQSKSSVPTYASHLQHVKAMPQSAILLGSCPLDKNHAFSAEDVIWGLQFHPEWNVQITQTYIEARSDALIKEGIDPIERINELTPCNQAYGLLSQFTELATKHAIR